MVNNALAHNEIIWHECDRIIGFVLYRHFSRKYNFLQKCCQSNNGSKIFDMLRFITMKTSYPTFVDSREQKYQG